MNPMQEFVVFGFIWCAWVGSMLGLLIVLVGDQNEWRKNVMREFDQ